MSDGEPVLGDDGKQLVVVRPADPQKAIARAAEITKISETDPQRAGELFHAMLQEQDYTVAGWLARRGDHAIVVDATGKYLEEIQPGDSFVSLGA